MNKLGMSYEEYSAHDSLGNAPHLRSADDEAAISRGDVKRVGVYALTVVKSITIIHLSRVHCGQLAYVMVNW